MIRPRLLGRPVIQIVSDIMALTTFREAFVHALGMGQAVTIGTLGHGLVLGAVAGRTGDLAVLGLAGRKGRKDRIVAGSTQLGSSAWRIVKLKRLVRQVTGRAVCLGHGCRVRLMTIGTSRDVAVGVSMAEVTGEGRMLARAGNHFLVGTGVTGDTYGLMLTDEANVQRLMGVVATEAFLFHLVVGASLVTVTAQGDIVGHTRPMTLVTRLTVYLSLVRRSICSNLGRLLGMTLDAVSHGKNRLLSQSDGTQSKNEHQRKSCQQQLLSLFLQHLSASSTKTRNNEYTRTAQ